jgi:hypothetical protein
MQPPPPILGSKDADHLRILAIFHYIFAGLALVGIGFLCLHFWVMNTVFTNPEIWKNAKDPPPPEFFAIFKWVYLLVACLFLVAGVLNLLSASYLRLRQNRIFSIVVAGLNCLQIPFGTALGIFTLVVLTRDSVRQSYGA